MRGKASSILLALALMLGGAAAHARVAQAADDTTTEHRQPGDHKAGHSEQGYHRSFQNAETWAKRFDDPARDAWQKPEDVLDALDIQPTARVADLGAGTGYFSARIAKRIPQGKLFAVDIEPDMMRYLGERAEREHLDVLVPVLASADAPNLPAPVDFILLVDTYHHIDNRVAYFAKLRSSLQPGGRIAVVDFKVDSPEGPPPEHRISPQKVTAELTAAGYSLVATHQLLSRQYFLVFKSSD